METSTSNRNFVQQIYPEEYNTQKKDYTEKALLELKSQMATFKRKSENDNTLLGNTQSESENDSDDCSSGEQSAKVNVIIKTYKDSTKFEENDTNKDKGLRKRRVSSKSIGEGTGSNVAANSLSNTIYVQRELDLQEIQKLKHQMTQLQNALEEEERKNHFLKLDLCNAQVDNSVLKKDLNTRNNRIKFLENMHHENWWQIIKLKIFIGFLVILGISLN